MSSPYLMTPVRSAAQIGDAYLRERVINASQPELTLMSYDGILRFLGQAAEVASFEPTGYEEKMSVIASLNEYIAKAQALVTDLNTALNDEAGANDLEREQVRQLAESLRAQYLFLNHHLSLALSRRSAGMVRQAMSIVQNWRDGWAGAMESLRTPADA